MTSCATRCRRRWCGSTCRPPPTPADPPAVTVTPKIPYIQVHVNATTTSHRHARLSVATRVIEPTDPVVAATTDPGQASAHAPGEAGGAARDEQPAQPTAAALTSTAAGAGQPTPDAAPAGPRLLVEITGTIRRGRSHSYRRSVKLRSTFTGYELRAALRAAGVEVTGRVRLADFDAYTSEAQTAGYLPIELASHHSLTLADLITRTNKRSLNWLADRLLMAAGAQVAGGPPSMSVGLEAMYRWLARAGVNTKEILVNTGSGLSHRTQLTTRTIVRVLRTATGYADTLSSHSLLDPHVFLHSLSIGGVNGTLRHRFRDGFMRGQVIGKTGTLENSVALSGFVRGDGDDVLCFSIVTNGNRWRARGRVRREHEQMVAAMRHYLEARTARRAELAAAEQARATVKTAAADSEPKAVVVAPGAGAAAAATPGAGAAAAATPARPAAASPAVPAALIPAAAAAPTQRPDSAPARP